MINQNADEATANSSAAERQKSRHGASGRSFVWRRESPRGTHLRQECKREDDVDVTYDVARAQTEHKLKTAGTSGKVSFGFFKNIKKYLQTKNLCRSKPKDKEMEISCPLRSRTQNESCQEQEHPISQEEVVLNRRSCGTFTDARVIDAATSVKQVYEITSDTSREIIDAIIKRRSSSESTAEVPSAIADISSEIANVPNEIANVSNEIANVPSEIADVPRDATEMLSDENKAKASLAEQLLNLSKYGWYWGPISADQADAKLLSEPDGAFLVRDSSDDRYVLTLSFKSSGKMLHARMEHSGGLFSLCNQRENEGFTSVVSLIYHSMTLSQSAVYCYSRSRFPGYPSFPVRLTKPVSRFTQVKSLQYLCRFVIRQHISLDNIHKLHLPESVKLYILEPHYWT